MTHPSSRFIRSLPPLRRVDRFLGDPLGTQERLLRRLLVRAARTEWGTRLDFQGAAAAGDVVAAFQARSPLHHYEDIATDVDRIRGGTRDVAWPGTFRHFAVSSGTASSGKIIPLSHDMLAANRSFSVGVALQYLASTGDEGLLLGKHLTLPGRIEEDARFRGTKIGEVSGLQAEYAPWYFRAFYQAIPNDVAFLPNWERKLEAIVDRTVNMDVRMLVMAPTWALVFFNLLLERFNERHKKNAQTIGEIWPNLRLFISGGVALSSYRDLLELKIGIDRMHFLETYGASEGFFSFQNDLSDPAMLLHLDNGVFFEFVRADEKHETNPTRYTLRDVEPDVRYAMYVSTCSGLWSYGVKDVVRFTSLEPYKLVVAGRTTEMLDRYGEALYGDEARSAVLHAAERSSIHVLNFHVAPLAGDVHRMPSHQWLVEFESEPDDLSTFSAEIDTYLQQVNRHYQIRREAGAFGPPQVVPLPRDTFVRWLRRTRTRISGQSKVPNMSEERGVAEGVLAVASEA